MIEDVPTYQTLYEKNQLIDEKKEFETGQISCAVFTSASTVKGFVEGTKGLDYQRLRQPASADRRRKLLRALE